MQAMQQVLFNFLGGHFPIESHAHRAVCPTRIQFASSSLFRNAYAHSPLLYLSSLDIRHIAVINQAQSRATVMAVHWAA